MLLRHVLLLYHFVDDHFLPFQEILELTLPANHLKEDDAASPDVLPVRVRLVIDLRRGEDGILLHRILFHPMRSKSQRPAKPNQFDEILPTLSKFYQHNMFRIDCLVNVPLLMAKLHSNQYLLHDLYNYLQTAHLLFVVKLVQRFSRDALEHDVEEVGLAEVFHNLDDVRVVKFLEYLHLLEGVEEADALASVKDLTDTVYPTIPFQHFSNNASSSPYHPRKMIQLMRVASLTINNLLRLDLHVFLSTEALDAGHSDLGLLVRRFAAHAICYNGIQKIMEGGRKSHQMHFRLEEGRGWEEREEGGGGVGSGSMGWEKWAFVNLSKRSYKKDKLFQLRSLPQKQGKGEQSPPLIVKYDCLSNISYFQIETVNNTMTSLKLKPNLEKNPTHHSHTRLTLTPAPCSQRMVEARERIDHHLGKTYKKLRLNLQKPINPEPPLKPIEHNPNVRTSNPKEMIKLIEMKRRKNYSTVEQYHSPVLKAKQPGTDEHLQGISNQQVMEYIHLIYQTYNIKDPLTDHNDEEETEATISKQRNAECESIDSARTTKVADNIVEVSEFDIGKGETNKKHNKIVITLRSKTISKHRRSNNPLFKQMESIIKGTVKTKEVIGEQQYKNGEAPTYRYCFACEQSILEANITVHEQRCLLLRQAYKFSFPKIIGILNDKISRIKAAISKQLLQVSSEEMAHRYSNLQQCIGTWLHSIDSPSSHLIQNWRGKYQKVKSQLSVGFLEPFQLLNKLHWFTRLRSNILSLHSK